MDPDNEAPRDPRAITSRASYTDTDYEGHRALSVYVGFHIPSYRHKGHKHRHHHHHHHHHHQRAKELEGTAGYTHNIDIPSTPPLERVRFILGGDEDESNEPHPVFSEMEELHQEGPKTEWRETARWVKFEEDVEVGGDRWSKPHIATVSLHSLLVLRSCILNGTVMLDLEANCLDEIADRVLKSMVISGQLQEGQQGTVKDILLCKHRHQDERRTEWVDKSSRMPIIKSLAEVGKNSGSLTCDPSPSGSSSFPIEMSKATADKKAHTVTTGASNNEDDFAHTFNYHPAGNDVEHPQNIAHIDQASPDFLHWFGKTLNPLPAGDKSQMKQGFMRKIPPDAQASNILVGEVDFLERYIAAFVRLNQACPLGDLTEVPIPTKFLFIILGPPSAMGAYHEVGRALAAVMSDEVFHDVAYKAKNRQDLLAGVDEFMDAATVLPAGVWDPNIRIEPLKTVIPQESRRKTDPKEVHLDCPSEDQAQQRDNGLKRTGRFFGGLVNDIQRKAPWYKSDFKDFFALQSIASVVFLYIACLAPIITFGGLLGDATKHRMGAMENLLSSLICGVVYALFSGQPLTILGTTGALLVFEGTIFNYCEWWGLEYLPFRLWIGNWTAFILLMFVAFDASVLVCYITRFTEEIFSSLISIIFIFKSIENVTMIGAVYPLKTKHVAVHPPVCQCFFTFFKDNLPFINHSYTTPVECSSRNGSYVPESCNYIPTQYVPNVFLFSIILFAGTFAVTILLRKIKSSPFFPTKVRIFISDFAVIIAMVSMTALDYSMGIATPKLTIPQEFKPTWVERGWLVPLFASNPWWTAIIAMVPALVATVLIFIDQQITAVIVNRRENKLKKGCGYHLDLFVLAILIAICSILGLPWSVAATILSMTHVSSLKKVAKCSAPGEKPQFLGVREQRGTHICICILVGLSIFFSPVLKHIPMPVLYGIFLYMGVISLKGIQFMSRTLILFMPQKYQPDYILLRHVPTRVVHFFTAIQILSLVILFVIKYFPESALCFPAGLLAVIFMRRRLLGHIFCSSHLKILDDDVPDLNENDSETFDSDKANQVHAPGSTDVVDESKELARSSVERCGFDRFTLSITELLTQSSVWKCIDQQSQKTPPLQKKFSHSSSLKKRKKDPKGLAVIDEHQAASSQAAENGKGFIATAQTSSSVPERLCNCNVNEGFTSNETLV